MKRLVIFSIICLALTLLAGCSKNQFSIDISLPGDVNRTYRVLYYASDSRGGMLRETAISVANGKGQIVCPAVNPSLIYIFSHSPIPFICYAEKGDKIVISGKSAEPYAWSAAGNDMTAALSEWMVKNSETVASADNARINRAVSDYVKTNPSDPISTILLLNFFSRRIDEPGYALLSASLKGDAADSRYFDLVSRADARSSTVVKPAKIKTLLLQAHGNAPALVRADSAPTLLYFWSRDNSGRDAAIDSLRVLAKEFRDSASRNIAYVCMEPDSLAWQNASRNDSLRKVVRAWMPLGFADRRAMSLGVTRTPYFIVTDTLGAQVYRGESPDSAAASFRSLMK